MKIMKKRSIDFWFICILAFKFTDPPWISHDRSDDNGVSWESEILCIFARPPDQPRVTVSDPILHCSTSGLPLCVCVCVGQYAQV